MRQAMIYTDVKYEIYNARKRCFARCTVNGSIIRGYRECDEVAKFRALACWDTGRWVKRYASGYRIRVSRAGKSTRSIGDVKCRTLMQACQTESLSSRYITNKRTYGCNWSEDRTPRIVGRGRAGKEVVAWTLCCGVCVCEWRSLGVIPR